jgi:hypothetical protein
VAAGQLSHEEPSVEVATVDLAVLQLEHDEPSVDVVKVAVFAGHPSEIDAVVDVALHAPPAHFD